MATFNVGRDFSRDPAGRFYTDGDASGEKFREEFLKNLITKLKGDETLEIVLDDDVDTYGSSFLSEAFAGAVRYGYVQADELLKKIKFSYSNPDYKFYADRVVQYVKEAVFNSEKYEPTKKAS